MMARSGLERELGDGFRDFMSNIIEQSVVTVENAWRQLELPGHDSAWTDATLLPKASKGLANSYEAMRAKLDDCAHLPRRWHDWRF